jgi:nicotinamide-nucleotide amidase
VPANELKSLLLREPRRTLAVAESLTCGRLQARIGEISGASEFFLGGITAYSLEQKVKHLGVVRAIAAPVNSVSAEVAEQMARGAGELFGADVAAATTGYAEPSPADGIVAPFAWWAIAVRDEHGGDFRLRHGRVECAGASRTEAQVRIADAVFAEQLATVKTWRVSG